ncbi:TRAP transporter large permease subunit [Lactobacillus sp. ESL0233]|uniref:C4-dicarboxylate transporter DcuC n=1 Tax=Lactobacillus sp. ESL0233 TaxID=2069354 RepID=UPI000EFCC090|nr:C4-dicarboxylate transporter DcuC [Lactobacillus sp. ESL0233]RMC42245.1 TRAP transporter large permease subunit [Lactobacillus sp. ESL0233]
MNQLIAVILTLLSVIVLVYMLSKKMDIKIVLFALGLVLLYCGIFMGNKISLLQPVANQLLQPIQVIIDQFTTTLSQAGFVILLLAGYSSYMTCIGANSVTIGGLTSTMKGIKSVYLLVPIVFLMGNILSLVVPSAANLAIILLATLYPVLRTAGMSRLTAAAVIATTATIIPTPLGSDNVAIAAALKMSVTQYVFSYHALISIPTLLLMAIVHYFWQKHEDKKDGQGLNYQAELAQYGLKDDDKQQTQVVGSKFVRFIYGLLPLLPIIILIIDFIFNVTQGRNLTMNVQSVTIISWIVAIIIELINKKDTKQVLNDTNTFIKGMGNAMGIVVLLIAAQTYVQGLNAVGIMTMIQKLMTNIHGAGILLPLIMVILTAIIVLLSGSGLALIFALIPLIVPLAKSAGIEPQQLAVPLQLAGNLLRAVSPVAAVILIVSGATHLEPGQIIRRTAVPMISGVLIMLVLSFCLL